MFENYKTELEKRRKQQKKEEKYRKSSLYRFKNSLEYWWHKYQHHYYHVNATTKVFNSYITTEHSPYQFEDGLENEVIKFVAFAVHHDLRGQGLGKRYFESVCEDADRAGCSIYLVANAFDVEFKEDAKHTLDLMDEYGIGFSESYFEPSIRKKSRRLQHWYIDNFGFQRCKYPEHTCVFSNKYLEKKAQLIRIPDTAKPEVKEKLKKYTR